MGRGQVDKNKIAETFNNNASETMEQNARFFVNISKRPQPRGNPDFFTDGRDFADSVSKRNPAEILIFLPILPI